MKCAGVNFKRRENCCSCISFLSSLMWHAWTWNIHIHMHTRTQIAVLPCAHICTHSHAPAQKCIVCACIYYYTHIHTHKVHGPGHWNGGCSNLIHIQLLLHVAMNIYEIICTFTRILNWRLWIGKFNDIFIGTRGANMCYATLLPVRWGNIFRREFKAQIIMLKLSWPTVLLFMFTMRLAQTHISNYTEIKKTMHRPYLEVVQFQFRLPSLRENNPNYWQVRKKWNHPIRINILYGRIIFPKTTVSWYFNCHTCDNICGILFGPNL